MAGHSKWANIRRRHAAQARRRDRRAVAEARTGSQSVRYEGYGPGGAAVMVECVTEDRGGTGARVRRAFLQHGGRLGADGSVSYLFNTVGLMTYPPGTDEERLMKAALEAGAEDVVPNGDGSVEVLADP
ncbi:MAG: YebC/PmpR family DNA-binding transcriptional regulator, partial [Gammaproteobacteria bacterium]